MDIPPGPGGLNVRTIAEEGPRRAHARAHNPDLLAGENLALRIQDTISELAIARVALVSSRHALQIKYVLFSDLSFSMFM